MELGRRVALRGGPREPGPRRRMVLRHTVAVQVHRAEAELGRRVAGLGERPEGRGGKLAAGVGGFCRLHRAGGAHGG